MIVYEFLYCPCIYESASATMSIHSTREGAEMAMNEHKEKCKKEWDDMYDENDAMGNFDDLKSWHVRETEVNKISKFVS